MSAPTIVTPRTSARRGDNDCPWCLHDLSKEQFDDRFSAYCSNCGNPIRQAGRPSAPGRSFWVRREGEKRDVTGFGSKTDQMIHIISRMKNPDKINALTAAIIEAQVRVHGHPVAGKMLRDAAEKVEAAGVVDTSNGRTS